MQIKLLPRSNQTHHQRATHPPLKDLERTTALDHESWLPDGYNRIFKIVCVWPFGLLDYGSATLRCKI